MNPLSTCFPLSRVPLALTALCGVAAAQAPVTFSIADGGATYGANDCAGDPINGAGILRPSTIDGMPEFAAPTPPCIVTPHAGPVSLHVGAGSPHVELDALSYGMDGRLGFQNVPGSVWFSVDEASSGLPLGLAPSVWSEAPVGDAAASAFVDIGLQLPVAAFWPPLANVEALDGDGLVSASGYLMPGLGVVEPHLPAMGVIGDDVDALDLGVVGQIVYFSLDGVIADPCGGAGWASAPNNGFSSAAIVFTNLMGPPMVWATPAALGLDGGGFSSDDLDALALWENGNGQYDAADVPFAWLNGMNDMVLFSVRRGSWVIGQLDSLYGQPIEEGDVLMPRIPGGLTPFPAIVIPAEQLGLRTLRSATATACNGVFHGDELDALYVAGAPLFDCNQNGQEDAVDIATGLELDADKNGVPDACECGAIVNYCTAGTSASGCHALLSATGIASASAASGFVVSASTVEGLKDGLFFFGQNGRQANPWGNSTSFQCVVPPVKRGGVLFGSGTVGACDGAFSQDLNARWCPACPNPAQAPVAGVPLQIQLWYRDPLSTSNQTTSMSDALEVIPCP